MVVRAEEVEMEILAASEALQHQVVVAEQVAMEMELSVELV
jgi:hypothetical protein